MRVEVRCCCDPERLIGWINIEGLPRPGTRVVFPLNNPISLTLEDPPTPMKFATLEVAVLRDKGNDSIAFKSNDLPIETFRRIRAFMENIAP